MLQVNSETDFVARNDQFISMVGQVAAAALRVPASGRQGAVLEAYSCPHLMQLDSGPIACDPDWAALAVSLCLIVVCCDAGGQLDTEALQQAKTPDGTSAAAAVDAIAGVIREKMALRRGVK